MPIYWKAINTMYDKRRYNDDKGFTEEIFVVFINDSNDIAIVLAKYNRGKGE